MLETSSFTNGTFRNASIAHQTYKQQTNELKQTTKNAQYNSTDSQEHILEAQVTAITDVTIIEIETTARSYITWLNAGFQYDTTTDYKSNYKVIIGRMTDVCRIAMHRNGRKNHQHCYSNGKVKLTLIYLKKTLQSASISEAISTSTILHSR